MEKLGIQPIPLILQVINFLILLFILKKFLYSPILKMLDERKKKIEEGLAYSEKMKSDFAKSENKRAEIVAKGKLEAQKMIADAGKEAKRKENEIITKAQQEAKELIGKAEKEISLMREKLEKDLHKRAVEIAARMVEKIIKEALTGEMQKSVVDKKLKQVEARLK